MKDTNYFVLKSGTIIRKDILAINNYVVALNSLVSEGSIASATYVVTFAETPQVIYISHADYLELKEILC